jgi:hypothetical protein
VTGAGDQGAGGRLLCVLARLISFFSSVRERVEFGGHHPKLARKRRVMGIGHLSQPSRTLADGPMKPRARPLQLMRHAATSHVAAAITDPKRKTMPLRPSENLSRRIASGLCRVSLIGLNRR